MVIDRIKESKRSLEHRLEGAKDLAVNMYYAMDNLYTPQQLSLRLYLDRNVNRKILYKGIEE